MAYLNGNATCFRPSLTIEQTEVIIPERPADTYELYYSSGEWECFADGGFIYSFFYENNPNISEGAEIKSVEFFTGGEWLTLESLAEKYDVYESVKKQVRYIEDVGGYVFSVLYFTDGGNNDFCQAVLSMMIEAIKITCYTD